MDPRRTLWHALLRVFPRVPRRWRRRLVRAVSPSYTLGAVLVVRDGDEVLLLRQRHYGGLTLPGGLLRRGEDAAGGLARELREEVGVHTDVELPVTAVVDAVARRVDLVYAARLQGDRGQLRPDDDEAVELCWRRWPEAVDATPATRVVLAHAARARGRGAEGLARPA